MSTISTISTHPRIPAGQTQLHRAEPGRVGQRGAAREARAPAAAAPRPAPRRRAARWGNTESFAAMLSSQCDPMFQPLDMEGQIKSNNVGNLVHFNAQCPNIPRSVHSALVRVNHNDSFAYSP